MRGDVEKTTAMREEQKARFAFTTSRCCSQAIDRVEQCGAPAWDYARPLRQVDVLLHGRQTLSPAQALGKSWRQIRQRRVFASLGGSASLARSSDTSSASFAVQGSRMSHLPHKL